MYIEDKMESLCPGDMSIVYSKILIQRSALDLKKVYGLYCEASHYRIEI